MKMKNMRIILQNYRILLKEHRMKKQPLLSLERNFLEIKTIITIIIIIITRLKNLRKILNILNEFYIIKFILLFLIRLIKALIKNKIIRFSCSLLLRDMVKSIWEISNRIQLRKRSQRMQRKSINL